MLEDPSYQNDIMAVAALMWALDNRSNGVWRQYDRDTWTVADPWPRRVFSVANANAIRAYVGAPSSSVAAA